MTDTGDARTAGRFAHIRKKAGVAVFVLVFLLGGASYLFIVDKIQEHASGSIVSLSKSKPSGIDTELLTSKLESYSSQFIWYPGDIRAYAQDAAVARHSCQSDECLIKRRKLVQFFDEQLAPLYWKFLLSSGIWLLVGLDLRYQWLRRSLVWILGYDQQQQRTN